MNIYEDLKRFFTVCILCQLVNEVTTIGTTEKTCSWNREAQKTLSSPPDNATEWLNYHYNIIIQHTIIITWWMVKHDCTKFGSQ